MTIAGIDGCRGGWVATVCDSGNWDLVFLPTLIQLFDQYDIQQGWIDIPIGLSSDNQIRDVDIKARKLLPKSFKSSIFTTPCRPAVYADNYQNACRINQEIEGKKLSIQAWNICAKIKEMDVLLQSYNSSKLTISESHPELCFYYLNNKIALNHKKNASAGVAERLTILNKYDNSLVDTIENSIPTFSKKLVQVDDIIDSAVLAISLKESIKTKSSIQITGTHKKDAMGIPIFLTIYDTQNGSDISNITSHTR